MKLTAFSLHTRLLTPLFQTLSPTPHELVSVVCNTSDRFRPRGSCYSFGFAEFVGRKLRVSSMSTGAVKGSSPGSLLAEFPFSASSSLKIQKGDITRWSVDGVSDAIELTVPKEIIFCSLNGSMVNPANERMLGGGGADGAIHRAAGSELKEACYKVPEVRSGIRCPTGEARITPGFKLPAAYVVHTVGPIYDEDSNPEASLKSAYRNSLYVAKENNIQYIAFPAISCGVYRYPIDEAATVAISTVKEFGADLKECICRFSDNLRNTNSTRADRRRLQHLKSLSPSDLIMSCCFGFTGKSVNRPQVLSTPARAGNGNIVGSRLVEFPMSGLSTLKILKGDITEWSVGGVSDAIVNPANERMLGGGGADGAIHGAAGRELKEACYNVPEVRPGVRCPTGQARITPGFLLPAAYVIHTVGPIYDVDSNPEASLRSAYRNSLSVAKENNIQYIAFTAISCGVFRYPLDEAATIAISTVKDFGGNIKEVHFVLFSDDTYEVWLKKAKQLLGN
ncbi:hypothetical protein V2J09_017541 [Rumex salicifolius]